jgi:hypothetical protein
VLAAVKLIYAGAAVSIVPLIIALGWLAGLAAVWLLWRPASSAFFKPKDLTADPL